MEGSLKKLLSEADKVTIELTSSLMHVNNFNETDLRVIAKVYKGESIMIELIEKDMDISSAVEKASAGILNSKRWAEAQNTKTS